MVDAIPLTIQFQMISVDILLQIGTLLVDTPSMFIQIDIQRIDTQNAFLLVEDTRPDPGGIPTNILIGLTKTDILVLTGVVILIVGILLE